MKNYYFLIFLVLTILPGKSRSQSNILVSKKNMVSFFSNAPLEDIVAVSNQGASAINLSTGEILFKVKINTFQFKKKLMQEHFNENYMESEKYPNSVFRGKISNVKKLSEDGKYILMVSGSLDIHGVSKKYESPVEFSVNRENISSKASFHIKLSDHQIKIPSVVWKKIAETVKVDISVEYSYKSK